MTWEFLQKLYKLNGVFIKIYKFSGFHIISLNVVLKRLQNLREKTIITNGNLKSKDTILFTTNSMPKVAPNKIMFYLLQHNHKFSFKKLKAH